MKVNDKLGDRQYNTYRFEYTPGTRASSNARGRVTSHRSGFHSYASSPQRALFVLQAQRLSVAVVPLGIGISVISEPSVPLIGSCRGRTVS